ncbi:MAG: UDP-glucose 4-epimerase GalE [Erysipelotrichaceae bacterium]|nr:UDP-glucose 4-epimerase GalE [Erysipelotrichaceae bacterium]
MSRVLLTGGTGYIGSHTAVSLLENGYDVAVVDNLVNSKADSIREVEKLMNASIPTYIGDVQDEELMDRIFRENGIDVVVHFAGLKAVGESVYKPLEYYRNNLDSTLVLIKSMLKNGVNRIVFSSSATVYDPANDPERVEGMPTGNCSCPYGWTKFMIEQIIRDCCHAYPQLNSVMLRYFNPVGAHPSGVIGENPLGIPNNLMPYIQQVAVGKLDHLSIFGNDYDTPDGTCIRDYIHVCDLADAHALACGYLLKQENCCEEINIGSGRGVSVLELVTAFEKANGMKLPYVFAPRRDGDLPVFFANADKAREVLGFECRRSVEDMCRDAYRYQCRQAEKE